MGRLGKLEVTDSFHFMFCKRFVRGDGERSSEILTTASSSPANQLPNDIFINQWQWIDEGKMKFSILGGRRSS